MYVSGDFTRRPFHPGQNLTASRERNQALGTVKVLPWKKAVCKDRIFSSLFLFFSEGELYWFTCGKRQYITRECLILDLAAAKKLQCSGVNRWIMLTHDHKAIYFFLQWFKAVTRRGRVQLVFNLSSGECACVPPNRTTSARGVGRRHAQNLWTFWALRYDCD